MKDINVYRIERHEPNGDVVSYGLIIGPRWLAREFARSLREERGNKVTYRERWLRTADATDREVLGEDACRTLIWEDDNGGVMASTGCKSACGARQDAGSIPATSTTYDSPDDLEDDDWQPDPRVRYET